MNARVHTSSFGKYQRIASLAQGGMANVDLALVAGPGGFNKLLVLKSMRAEVVDSIEGGLTMFLDEARLTARLVHPNIATTYEVGEHAGSYFIAMEYLEGQTYREVCHRARPDALSFQEELRILVETAHGLHHAHELLDYDGTPLHVVHRDVSPQNVFVTYDGLVKLLDFGIAKTSESEPRTEIGVIKGKLDYIAPEQLRAEAIDRRADVFALGAMLWEAITNKRFAGGRKLSDVLKVQNRLAGGERKVRDLRPDVPEALARIVERATALSAQDRFESAAAFAHALEGYAQASGLAPSARSLSAAIVPLFAEQRRSMRKTVDEAVRLSRQRDASWPAATAMVSVPPSAHDSTSSAWLGGEESTRARSAAPVPALGSLNVPADEAAIRTRSLVAAGVVLVLAAFVGGTLAATSRTPSPSWVAAPAARAAPPAASAPSVRLQLTVSPLTARATLDGAALTTPFRGELLQDRVLHQLVVKADGYRATKQLVSLDRDSALQITLDKLPSVATRRARPTSVAASRLPAKSRPSARPTEVQRPHTD